MSLCHAGSTRDSFLPGLPKTIGPNLAQVDTCETSRQNQLPIQTWTTTCSSKEERKDKVIWCCRLTSGVRVKGGREGGNNTVCTSGVIACDAMLIMRKVASGMGRALGCSKSSN